MPRRYEQKRRAERQEETRRRIVEAAISLHGTLGVSRTTVTDIARLAGVGRLTVYRHFPDELSLGRACSGTYFERNPLPDPEVWRKVAAPRERFRAALRDCYSYHRRTEAMIALALADIPDSPLMQPYYDHWRRAADVVVAAWPASDRRSPELAAAIGHALAFTTWRSLVRERGLADARAIALMLRLV